MVVSSVVRRRSASSCRESASGIERLIVARNAHAFAEREEQPRGAHFHGAVHMREALVQHHETHRDHNVRLLIVCAIGSDVGSSHRPMSNVTSTEVAEAYRDAVRRRLIAAGATALIVLFPL